MDAIVEDVFALLVFCCSSEKITVINLGLRRHLKVGPPRGASRAYAYPILVEQQYNNLNNIKFPLMESFDICIAPPFLGKLDLALFKQPTLSSTAEKCVLTVSLSSILIV